MNRNVMRNRRNGGGNMPVSSTIPSLLQPGDKNPVMFEYLENLDRELNELKKKREIIEQQQGYFQNQNESNYNIYDREREFSYDASRYYEQIYDAPQASHSGYNSSQSFGAMAHNNDYIPLKSNRKRQRPWQDDNMTKRFSGFEGNNIEKSFGSRLGPKPMGFNNEHFMQHKKSAPSISSQKPKRLMSSKTSGSTSSGRTEFKSQKKISKNKVAPNPPNNMNAYPVATRKALIEQTIQSDVCSVATRKPLVGQPAKAKTVDKSLYIYADGEPTPKVRGRLELALGHISKLVKEQTLVDIKKENINHTYEMQRLIKQIIRERIRTIMLGKYVGPCMEVVAAYREQFPPETDKNLLKAAYEKVKSSFKYKKADSAEEFLKLNMDLILKNKLNEMFTKLEKLYKEPEKPLKDDDVEIIEEPICEKIDLVEDEQDDANNSKIPEECNKLTIPIDELDNLIQQKLPSLLKTYVPYLADIMKLDYKYESSIADLVIKTNKSKAFTGSAKSKLITKPKADKKTVNNDTGENTNTKPDKTPSFMSTLRYVKVIGRPTLPKRKVMQEFLDQFEPRVIKKHKKQHNLLFVGFLEEKNFDAVLANDGATVGNNIIEIKASESTGIKSVENEKTEIVNNGETFVLDTSFGDELDNQIDDLLSSIRQSEDKNDNNITDLTIEDEVKDDDSGSIPNDQNELTIISDSDDEQNEVKIIQINESNSELHSQIIPENIMNKSEELPNKTVENTEESMEIIKRTEEITEGTVGITEVTVGNSEGTEETAKGTEEIAKGTEEITGETVKITEETEKNTEGTEKNAEETEKNTEGTEENTKGTEEINKENILITEITQKNIEGNEEKIKKDPVAVMIPSSDIVTSEDINIVQVKETVTSDKEEEVTSKDIPATVIIKNENLIQDEIANSNVNVKEHKVEVKEIVQATPTRASSRLAKLTTSTIKTRRASKLATNNE